MENAAKDRLGAVVIRRMELEPPPVRFYAGSIALLVVAAALGGLGVWLVDEGTVSVATGIGFVVLGAVCAGSGVFGLARRAALRCAVSVHEEGIVVSRRGTDAVIPYSEVRDFSFKQEVKLDNGTPAGLLRTLGFVWPGGRVWIVQFASNSTEDRFEPVVTRLLGKLADAAEARLATGASLPGIGWVLDSSGLRVAGQEPVRLSALANHGVFEGKISFWRSGEELPFLSIPEASPNAWLLGILSRRQSTRREQPMAGSLGRILFQKQLGTAGLIACWGFASLFFLVGTAFLIGLTQDGSFFGGALFAIFGWGMALAFISHIVSRFRVYELGITKRSLFGTRTLRYSELTGFQFRATRHYYNGVYTGTMLDMSFLPGEGGKELSHKQMIRGIDLDLDALREQVAESVAAHLLERLDAGEEIPWGPTARFTKGGLVLRTPKLFGRDEERRVPYDSDLTFVIKEGTFQLFVGGEEPNAAMSIDCAAGNFYPGLKILEELAPFRSKGQRLAG